VAVPHRLLLVRHVGVVHPLVRRAPGRSRSGHPLSGGAAWYRLPALTEQIGSAEIARNGAGYYRGYREIVRRFAFRPFDSPVHPLQ
jgi:hypothetical protein